MAFPETHIASELGYGNLEMMTILYDMGVLHNDSRLRLPGIGQVEGTRGVPLLHCIAHFDAVGGDIGDARFNRLKACVDFLIEHGYAMNTMLGQGRPENALYQAIDAFRPRLALYLIEKGVDITPNCLDLARNVFTAADIEGNRWVRQLMHRLTTVGLRRNIPGAVIARTARRVFAHRAGINIASPAGSTLMQMVGGPSVLRVGNAGAHVPAPRRRKTRRRS